MRRDYSTGHNGAGKSGKSHLNVLCQLCGVLMAYDAIFSRPIMKETYMVTILYCLTIKFPTLIEIGFFREYLKKEREYQVREIKPT